MAMVSTNTTHLRDASFSSYLNPSEEAFVRKLAESSVDHNPKTTPPNENFHFGRKKAEEDGEIGVFGAEKYFNEGRHNEDVPRMFKDSDFGHDGEVFAVPMKPRTPSVYSESSSSWNSQSALLKNVLRKPPLHKKRSSKNILTSIRCINCSCSDNKSVDIREKKKKPPKRSLSFGGFEGKEAIKNGMVDSNNSAELNPWIMKQIQSRKIEDGFSFPVLSSKPVNLANEDNTPKKSLEVFGSPATERKKKNSFNNLDRRTPVLPWNPNAGLEELDTESDASSDLFEIEDFRGSNGKDFFLQRNASDGMSSYAPSEASIEWSVVTASAADFEDLMAPSEATRGYKMSPKETEKRRSGILSGCKSQKAVMVVGDAHRTNAKAFADQRMLYRSDSFGRSATRFQVEARKSSFDSRNRPYSFDAGAMSR